MTLTAARTRYLATPVADLLSVESGLDVQRSHERPAEAADRPAARGAERRARLPDPRLHRVPREQVRGARPARRDPRPAHRDGRGHDARREAADPGDQRHDGHRGRRRQSDEGARGGGAGGRGRSGEGRRAAQARELPPAEPAAAAIDPERLRPPFRSLSHSSASHGNTHGRPTEAPPASARRPPSYSRYRAARRRLAGGRIHDRLGDLHRLRRHRADRSTPGGRAACCWSGS